MPLASSRPCDTGRRRRLGHEAAREQLAERRVLATPAEAGDVHDRLEQLAPLRIGLAAAPAARIAAVQHQVRHALGVAHRVLDHRGRALADAEQHHRPVDARRLHDLLEVAGSGNARTGNAPNATTPGCRGRTAGG
jgi:hypothetical protein